MNIIDAIKSGKKFRRKGTEKWNITGGSKDHPFWIGEDPYISDWTLGFDLPYLPLNVTDILADDWEIQEPGVTLTKSMFVETAYGVLKDRTPTAYLDITMSAYSDFIEALAGKLGFSDAT